MSIPIKSVYDWYKNLIRNPKYRYWMILGTLLYLISPIDIAPDFIPIIGQIDDVVIVSLLVSEISQMAINFAKTRQQQTVSDNNPSTVDVEAKVMN